MKTFQEWLAMEAKKTQVIPRNKERTEVIPQNSVLVRATTPSGEERGGEIIGQIKHTDKGLFSSRTAERIPGTSKYYPAKVDPEGKGGKN